MIESAFRKPDHGRPGERGTAGSVTVRVMVDATGRPADVQTLPQFDRPGLYSVKDVLTVAPVPGPTFHAAAVDAVRQWVYTPPANGEATFVVQFMFLPEGRVRLVAHEMEAADRSPAAAAERGAADAPVPEAATAPRVGPVAPAPRRTRCVNPIYPADARAKGIEGVVIIDITIDAQGRVTSARVVRSIPELDAAALEAVRQWEFEPSLVNGQPGSVSTTVTVAFSLLQFSVGTTR